MDGTATRLRAAAAAAVESSWLSALMATPLLFVAGADRVFEEPKILLLRSLAGMIVAGLLVWVTAAGRTANPDGRSMWRGPIVATLLWVTAAYALATAFSIDPHVSFWGAYRRSQGLYTWLAYVAVFVAIVVVADRHAVDRLVTVAILSSLAPAIYGIAQHFGADPLRWDPLGDRIGRIIGSAGNPIFFSAYLIMIVPLTISRILIHVPALRRRGPTPSLRFASRHAWMAAVYALVLMLQMLAIIYSRSIGPRMGLVAGLTLFGLVCTFRYRWWRGFVSILAALAAGAVFLALFNLPTTPLGRFHDVKYLNEMARIARVDHGTNTVRIMIWEGTLALLAANPLRTLVGYGPDVMPLVYGPYYPPALIDYESGGAIPDRAHNQTLDALVGIGIAGWIPQMLLFASVFLLALRRLGVISTPLDQRRFIAAVAAGACLGVVVPRLFAGSFVFSALGLGVGVIVGMLTFVVATALARWHETAPPPSTEELLLAGALAAITAHFVELQVGIAVVATQLCFFVMAALVVLLSMASPVVPQHRRRGFEIFQQGSAVGVGLIVLMFDFYLSNDLHSPAGSIVSCLSASLLLGGGLLALQGAHRKRLRSVSLYFLAAAAPATAFALVCVWRSAVQAPIDDALERGWQLADADTILYAAVLLCIGLPALGAFRRAREESAMKLRLRDASLYGAAFVAALALSWLNLNGARADRISGFGAGYEARGSFDAAAALYEAASKLQPSEEVYSIAAGRAYTEQARKAIATGSAVPHDDLSAAETALQRAETLNPLNPQSTWNLARLHRLWADAQSDPDVRAHHASETERDYAAALRLQPHNSILWNEWATMYRDRGDLAKALEVLDKSLNVHESWKTYCLRGGWYLQQGEFEPALLDYKRALRLKEDFVEAWSGKAAALAGLNHLDEAVAAGRRAAELAPADPLAHGNLALLYRQTGQLQAAIASARTAVQLASPAEKPGLEQLFMQLTAEVARSQTP